MLSWYIFCNVRSPTTPYNLVDALVRALVELGGINTLLMALQSLAS